MAQDTEAALVVQAAQDTEVVQVVKVAQGTEVVIGTGLVDHL
jgi:hypothetical protein